MGNSCVCVCIYTHELYIYIHTPHTHTSSTLPWDRKYHIIWLRMRGLRLLNALMEKAASELDLKYWREFFWVEQNNEFLSGEKNIGVRQVSLNYVAVVVVWSLSHVCLCDPVDCSATGLLCLWDFPGKNTGVRCHFLLQGIFLT